MDYVFQSDYYSSDPDPRERLLVCLTEMIFLHSDIAKKYRHHHQAYEGAQQEIEIQKKMKNEINK